MPSGWDLTQMEKGARMVQTAGVAYAKALGPGLGAIFRDEEAVW